MVTLVVVKEEEEPETGVTTVCVVVEAERVVPVVCVTTVHVVVEVELIVLPKGSGEVGAELLRLQTQMHEVKIPSGRLAYASRLRIWAVKARKVAVVYMG